MPVAESDILRSLTLWRSRVLALDAEAARALALRWLQVAETLQPVIRELIDEALKLHAAGEKPSDAFIYKLRRFESLYKQTYEQIGNYGQFVSDLVTKNQLEAAEFARLSVQDQLQRMGALSGTLNRLPVRAVTTLTGALTDGAPLRTYFLQGLQADTVQRMADVLIRGIALGQNPRVIAQAMAREAGIPYRRALAISRTEVMRTFRLNQIDHYRQSRRVEGWMWICSKGTMTCMACIAMDGRTFPLSVEFVDHPNGRCSSLALLPGRTPQFQTGAQWFAEQSEATQRKMLGPGAYDAWRGKKISIADMATPHSHPTFGTHYARSSVSQALANADARRFAQRTDA